MKILTNGFAFKPKKIARRVMRRATIINMMGPTKVRKREIQEAGHLLSRRLKLKARALLIAIGASALCHLGNAACPWDTLQALTHGTSAMNVF